MIALLIPYPVIDPVLVNLGPLPIRWYALAYVAGLVAGWAYARLLCARESLWRGVSHPTPISIDDLVVYIAFGIVLGGRLGYVLFYNFPYYSANPAEIFAVWKGGMAFHGGLAGSVLAIWLFARRVKAKALSVADVVAAGVPIGLFCGRLANFIKPELWGRETDVPWAMIFPGGGPLPRHPSQLYEAGLEGLVLFVLLAILIRAGALSRPGLVAGVFGIGYGVARITCEFFREPDAQLGFLFGGATMGMLLSLPVILAGLAAVAWALRPPAHRGGVTDPAPLAALIADLIRDEGPIGIDRYMALALGHPRHGYYMKQDPFGAAGDFTTAPEISQMFGEMIGLWAAAVFEQMGAPGRIALVELGPGRGTLMADMLRAIRIVPAFRAALEVHLVETSPVLRERQADTLRGAGAEARWHATLETVPDGPLLVVANEFFDALPVRHYVRTADGWRERLIGLDAGGALTFGLAPMTEPRLTLPAPQGSILEIGLEAQRVMGQLAARLVRDGGAGLVLDYGDTGRTFGETLQAVIRHRFVDPLTTPGDADLTAHVDFAALARVAGAAGAIAHGPATQGAFLRQLGIGARADRLARTHPDKAEAVRAALERLAGPGSPAHPGMGELFKVLAITAPGHPAPPGFARQEAA